ncbi:MAG: formylmethanofuran--tetrahydromethanopterin N-formyltransferase [Phycisphaeraceae bacterium]|nr:formylmethanofuran--tetrahydromethanopterin N-formyltransferase [Phycisphaeraceae bacterium]
MNHRGVIIEDEFAEAFRMWACRLIVTARDDHWLDAAVREVTGYGSSVIGCDAEAGLERRLTTDESPDGRPGAAVLLFAFNAKALTKSVPNRVGQCLMTCPTTAVYDGMAGVTRTEDSERIDVGNKLRFFGDGFQKSKVVAGRRYWRVPVMDGEFVVEQSVGAVKAIGGGNMLIEGAEQGSTLDAARRAVDAIAPLPDVITPFPGGVVRSGSKVGSRYKALFASSNDEYCPVLRTRTKSKLRPGVTTVYEIVINGLNAGAISHAMCVGIDAACDGPGVIAVSAGNYGGNLGKFHFRLHDVMKSGGGA